MVIGLTGKYCAGKNAAEAFFSGKGIPSIDVDKLGHQALEAESGRIAETFGSEVINQPGSEHSGRVDRKALGSIVFADSSALEKLENIIHPWMKAETARLIEEKLAAGTETVLVNAAILHKMGLDELCDCIIWVEAPLCIRLIRGLKRDRTGLFSVLKRIYTQRQLKPKPSGNSVDIYKVGNGSNLAAFKRKLDSVLTNIEQKGRNGR